MDHDELDQTMQQLQRLARGFGRPPAEVIQHAQDFIGQAYPLLMAEPGAIWQRPTVEAGAKGRIAFLWQDGQRYLSLLIGAEDPVVWLFNPGNPGGPWSLDLTSRMSQGTCTAKTFASYLWPIWQRGDDPARTSPEG